MAILELVSHSEEQTEQVAEKLAPTLGVPSCLVLQGPLGSGKTAFVRGLARGLGLGEIVHSPSYTIVNHYKGTPSLLHVDLYRLHDLSELKEIGWDDLFSRQAIVAIEWGERAEMMLPAVWLRVAFTITAATEREIRISLVSTQEEE